MKTALGKMLTEEDKRAMLAKVEDYLEETREAFLSACEKYDPQVLAIASVTQLFVLLDALFENPAEKMFAVVTTLNTGKWLADEKCKQARIDKEKGNAN